ncbi:MAG: AbrB/MazE/SpoVT family DNA-binding domain-containing protein [Candidatus Woesearchaeota archaeon]|nr:AbrB/MazE/SpoVT family DNA-binding domain-containing protein [Candidatus Woesearchaeota archaeon]
MKEYTKTISCDARGQIVIPKEIRKELSISEGTAFWAFVIENEGLLLRKIPEQQIEFDDPIINEIMQKSDKIGIDRSNIKKTIDNYSIITKEKEEGKLKEI